MFYILVVQGGPICTFHLNYFILSYYHKFDKAAGMELLYIWQDPLVKLFDKILAGFPTFILMAVT